LRLKLPLPAGLPRPHRLDAERWRRTGPSCPCRCGAPDGHHEPLLLWAHARAAEESLVVSRLQPNLGRLLHQSAWECACQARGGRLASFEHQRGRPSAMVARPDSPEHHGLPWPPPALPPVLAHACSPVEVRLPRPRCQRRWHRRLRWIQWRCL
jgi:hypothetical protein